MCHGSQHISLSTLAVYDFDVISGGGTGGSWWTVLTRVCCGVNEQLVSRDTEAQMRADMEALMARLIQTEQALMDTRQQVAVVPKVTVPLVDTRTIGKAPTFTGEHKNWPEWSFQFTAYMGSANPKSIEALRWAAMEEDKITVAAVVKQSFEEHNPQLYLASALLCKGSALVTVKNTEVNNGLEAWRGLNAVSGCECNKRLFCDSSNHWTCWHRRNQLYLRVILCGITPKCATSLSGIDEDVSSTRDGKPAWAIQDPTTTLERQLVSVESSKPICRDVHDRRHPSQMLFRQQRGRQPTQKKSQCQFRVRQGGSEMTLLFEDIQRRKKSGISAGRRQEVLRRGGPTAQVFRGFPVGAQHFEFCAGCGSARSVLAERSAEESTPLNEVQTRCLLRVPTQPHPPSPPPLPPPSSKRKQTLPKSLVYPPEKIGRPPKSFQYPSHIGFGNKF